jgi:hypothetical protein
MFNFLDMSPITDTVFVPFCDNIKRLFIRFLVISPIFARKNAKSSAISFVKFTAFILVFIFAFYYAGTPKD